MPITNPTNKVPLSRKITLMLSLPVSLSVSLAQIGNRVVGAIEFSFRQRIDTASQETVVYTCITRDFCYIVSSAGSQPCFKRRRFFAIVYASNMYHTYAIEFFRQPIDEASREAVVVYIHALGEFFVIYAVQLVANHLLFKRRRFFAIVHAPIMYHR